MATRERDATIQLKVRMKEPLRAELAAEAERNGVSLNTEIVTRLTKTLRETDLAPDEIWTFMKVIAAPAQTIKSASGKTSVFDPAVVGDFLGIMVGILRGLEKRYADNSVNVQASASSVETGKHLGRILFDITRAIPQAERAGYIDAGTVDVGEALEKIARHITGGSDQ